MPTFDFEMEVTEYLDGQSIHETVTDHAVTPLHTRGISAQPFF
jgi:hypothetical protein